MLVYLFSLALFYSDTVAKAIIIISLTYSGGFFLITTLNRNYNIPYSTIASNIRHFEKTHNDSENRQRDPVAPHEPSTQNHDDAVPILHTSNDNNNVTGHLPQQLDIPPQGKDSPRLCSFSSTSNNRTTSTHTPELLDTLYEEKESPTSLTFDNIDNEESSNTDNDRNSSSSSSNNSDSDSDKNQETSVPCFVAKNTTTSPITLSAPPTPTPSLSSPPSMDSSRYFCQRSSQPQSSMLLSVSTDLTATTPPLDISPSVSTSTTASQCLTPTPSCSTTSTSSLRQKSRSRRNSRVGQLVQQFEIGRLKASSSTPTIMTKPDLIYPGSTTRVTDTIATLHNRNSGKPKPSHRPINNINTELAMSSATYSPTLCHSPSNLTPSTSGRTIDHRSIGFRPVFTTWEKRISEAQRTAVPSPSMSTPVWSSRTRN